VEALEEVLMALVEPLVLVAEVPQVRQVTMLVAMVEQILAVVVAVPLLLPLTAVLVVMAVQELS
jgi:hypothetical protein